MAPAVSDSEETAPGSAPTRAPGRSGPSKKRTLLAEQELRLLSTLVLLLGVGLFLALPFVLSIGSVVFLPLVAALMLTILLSPLADWLTKSLETAQRKTIPVKDHSRRGLLSESF